MLRFYRSGCGFESCRGYRTWCSLSSAGIRRGALLPTFAVDTRVHFERKLLDRVPKIARVVAAGCRRSVAFSIERSQMVTKRSFLGNGAGTAVSNGHMSGSERSARNHLRVLAKRRISVCDHDEAVQEKRAGIDLGGVRTWTCACCGYSTPNWLLCCCLEVCLICSHDWPGHEC